MNVPPEILHVVRQWVERAEEDLRNAEHTLTLQKHCPFGTVCFHAQQAVEKYIKALLTCLNLDFPKTHDLGELIRLLPSEIVLHLTPREQETLTRYATVTRYPGNWEPLLRSETEEAVAVARRTREAVREYLPRNLSL